MVLGTTRRADGDSLPVRHASHQERFRILQWLRGVAVALVLLGTQLVPGSLPPYPRVLVVVTLGATVLAVAAGIGVGTRTVTARCVVVSNETQPPSSPSKAPCCANGRSKRATKKTG